MLISETCRGEGSPKSWLAQLQFICLHSSFQNFVSAALYLVFFALQFHAIGENMCSKMIFNLSSLPEYLVFFKKNKTQAIDSIMLSF